MSEKAMIQAQINQVNQDVASIRASVDKLGGLPADVKTLTRQNDVLFEKLDEYQKSSTNLQIDLAKQVARCEQRHNGNGKKPAPVHAPAEDPAYRAWLKWLIPILITAILSAIGGGALVK